MLVSSLALTGRCIVGAGLAGSAGFFLKFMGILRENEIPFQVASPLLRLCSRCRNFMRDKGRLGEIEVRSGDAACRCQKQCDRLIEGVCADCGHYVRHP